MKYNIDLKLVDAFSRAWKWTWIRKCYDCDGYNRIHFAGSAEVLGLMCFMFLWNKNYVIIVSKRRVCSLGATFQKVNFLRDIKADYNGLSRVYFPGCDFNNFTEEQTKRSKKIYRLISECFTMAFANCRWKARFGVYVAYKYYLPLFKKSRDWNRPVFLEERIRFPLLQGAHLQGWCQKSITLSDMEITEVILVDEQDQPCGVVEKWKPTGGECYTVPSAFFIFNSQGEMLLQQRAFEKYHSGGLWTNACCSHPFPVRKQYRQLSAG